MNIWLISAIVVGVLLLGGIAIIASAQITQAQNQQAESGEVTGEAKSCGYVSSSECPYAGKCDTNRDCGLAGCGAAQTGGCGCGR
jgi:hypothetical protein